MLGYFYYVHKIKIYLKRCLLPPDYPIRIKKVRPHWNYLQVLSACFLNYQYLNFVLGTSMKHLTA